MISQHNIRSKLYSTQRDTRQTACGIARAAVACRRVVAKAAKLSARGATEDVEDLLSFEAPSTSPAKIRRSLLQRSSARVARRTTANRVDEDDDEHHHQEEEVVDDETPASSDRTAALRDGSATASTSGHAHLHANGASGRLTTAAAVAAAANGRRVPSASPSHQATINGFALGGGIVADSREQTQGPHHMDEVGTVAGVGGPKQQHHHQPAHPLPPGVTAERDRAMYDELRSCEDWRDVLDVLADEVESLSLRTAVQALTRLNALSKGAGAAAREELVGTAEFQQLVAVLHYQVRNMNNVQLSNTLQALSQLQSPIPDDVLEQYFATSKEKADNFYPRDIATLLSAAATMRAVPPKDVIDTLGFRATQFLKSDEFDARSIPTLLHALATLGYKNRILATAAAENLARPEVTAQLTPQGVSNSMWALARTGVYHQPAVEAALAAFSQDPLAYKPQECANLLWALTALRHHPQAAFALFSKSLVNRLDQLRAADMATLLYSLGFFNVSPGQQLLDRLTGRVKALLAAGGPAGSGSGVNLVELCNMYWGLALVGAVDAPLFAKLEARLAAEWERVEGKVPESLMRMMFQAFLASRLVDSGASKAPGLPPLVLDACKRAWTAAVAGPEVQAQRRVAVESVSEILDKLQVKYDKRRPTGDGLALIDLALKAGPEKYVALQVLEDVHHCVNDARQLVGTTVMQRMLLERNGWEVRFLNMKDLERLTPEVRPLFVAELLQRLGIRVRSSRRQAEKAAAAVAGAGAAAPPRSAEEAEAEAAAKAADPTVGKGGRPPAKKTQIRKLR